LGHAEIIVDDNKSIWFIDRANKYWYLELRSSGTLWWRYTFFNDFFPLFGMVREEYEPVIAEWVEEVLKRGVSSTLTDILMELRTMEEVFNREVSSTILRSINRTTPVEEVLKRKVNSTDAKYILPHWELEKVLQIKIQPEETNLKRVLSLKAGVRECKIKIKKILKKIIS
jgi:predicted nucleotidyltransferase